MSEDRTHVYDKSKYHEETVEEAGLPEVHTCNHIVFFLRWLIENELTSDMFRDDGREPLEQYRQGDRSIHELFWWWDGCLVSDMLSKEGNSFAMEYFDYDKGAYLADYTSTLQRDLPSEFHIEYTEANYAKMKRIIDDRFREWRRRNAKP